MEPNQYSQPVASTYQPSGKAKTTARDFFLYLAAVITLYASVVSLINLLFTVINTAFPDELSYYVDPYSYGLRMSVATLIIIFPLYLILMRIVNRDVEQFPERRDIGVRRWLTFLTLFLTGAAIVVDLIVLINTFLGGEITTRFVLKVLVVLGVTGMVFGYYLYELRASSSSLGVRRAFRYTTIIIVLASIIGAFAYIGSPMTQRAKRFDQERTSDLQNIQRQIINNWQRKGQLPATLLDMEDSISGYKIPTDPESGKNYEYNLTGDKSFQLCAVFKLSTEEINRGSAKTRSGYISDVYYPGDTSNWDHERGRQCFDRTIDTQLYPVYEKTAVPTPRY